MKPPGDIHGFVADISSIAARLSTSLVEPLRYMRRHMDTMSGKLMLTRL
ncbi:MAG: hypothetical protein ACLTV6_15590 [Christensenellales bacterium]